MDTKGTTTFLPLLLQLQHPQETHADPPPPAFFRALLFDSVHIDLHSGQGVPLHTCTNGQQPCGLKLMWNNDLVLY